MCVGGWREGMSEFVNPTLGLIFLSSDVFRHATSTECVHFCSNLRMVEGMFMHVNVS